MNRYRFRPKLWVSVLACLGILAGLALGNWQLNRAQEKIALQRTLEQADRQLVVSVPSSAADPKTFNLRHVEANGNFVPEHTIYLDNKMHSGMVGYNVITPLRIAQSQKYVLVNRGWIKAGDSRENLPPL